MIAEVLREDVYSVADMAAILFARKKRLPTAESRQKALLRRINTRTDVPPFCEFEGEYYFPKAAFREWALKRPLLQEVRRVG